MLKEILNWLKKILEKLDHMRDRVLFVFIQNFWPKWLKPNYLTYVRLIIGVVLFVLLFYYDVNDKAIIIGLFVVGVLTDLFDGSVARCLKMETKFGALIDPIADRIIILPIAIYALIKTHHWLLFTLLALEIINGLVSAYALSKNFSDSPNIFAKTKMVIQSFAFGWILLTWPCSLGIFIINVLWISAIFYILAIFLKTKNIIKI